MPCGKRNADVGDLRVGLVLAEPALSVDGRLLVGKGQRITESMLLLLRNFAKKGTLAEPLFVYDDHAGSSTSDEPAAMTASV